MTGQNAGGNAGNPAMTIAVGTEQFRKSYLFHAPVSYETSYVNVVAKTGVAVHLDGADIPAAAFTAIGGTGYSVARSTLSNGGSGNHLQRRRIRDQRVRIRTVYQLLVPRAARTSPSCTSEDVG